MYIILSWSYSLGRLFRLIFLGLTKIQNNTILEVKAGKLSQVHKSVMVQIWENEIPKQTHIYILHKKEN